MDGSCETFCHIYIPNNFFQNKKFLNCSEPQFLLGRLETLRSESPPIKNIVKIVITSIQSDSNVENEMHNMEDSKNESANELLTYIGTIKGSSNLNEQEKTLQGEFLKIAKSLIWLTLQFDVISGLTIIDKVIYEGQVIPFKNLIFLTFDPKSLSRFIISSVSLNNRSLDHTLVPPIICSSIVQNFSSKIPKFDKENSKLDSTTDEENDKKWKVLERSVGLKQISHKLSSVSKIIREDLSWITLSNLIVILMIDAFLGTLVSSYLLEFPNLYSIILGRVESMLQVLLQLISWLGGSPAGLKLNTALNALMGRFFSYHLHLWRNYIGILEPLLSFILSTLINAGFFGLTLQIALAKDLLSIATFHIYCLYIYATRIFNIELNILKSLGRLFFGRKWNPLRNRIDSVHLSNSEMFISSMGFTISVFLAPTTVLYYMVFLSLRLPCLVLESLLSFLVEIFNSMEPVSCFLVLINSSWVADDVYITPSKLMCSSNDGYNIQSYEIRTQTTRRLFNVPNFSKPVGEIFYKILHSQVITQ